MLAEAVAVLTKFFCAESLAVMTRRTLYEESRGCKSGVQAG